MPRWTLVVLLVAAVVCSGVGADLTITFIPSSAADFGWTAYSPLSKTVYWGSSTPIDTSRLAWAPRLGVVLLVLGAGTTGAAAVALLFRRRRASSSAPTP